MVGNIVNVFFSTPIQLQQGQKIVFGNKNQLTMTAKWYYGYVTELYQNLCISTSGGSDWSVSSAPLYVDYLVI